MLETIHYWSGVLGLILTGLGLTAVAYQLTLTRKQQRNDFMLRFYDHVQDYNSVQLRLASGDWHISTKGPETREEWNSVRRYMGLLEALWQLIEDGLYPKERADRDYSHRVFAIVTNSVIHKQCLGEERKSWQDFIELWCCLESCEVYRELADEYAKKGGKLPKAPSVR
jgi:hypothetical protein